MINIDVMQDASEIVHYDNPKIPLYIRLGLLSVYPDMKALCHWHEDIELILILEGEMNYDVNGKKILLHIGDTILVNARQMHYGYENHKRECSFICILFHPNLLMTHSYTTQKYIKPILENSSIEYIYYEKGKSHSNEIVNLINTIMNLKKQNGPCYEFDVISKLFSIWTIVYTTCSEENLINLESTQSSDLDTQKKMVSYIYQKYDAPITLDDIAQAGSVSRSKCCILFKKYLKQSPVDFLNTYRLEVSCNLLKDTEEPISNIAFACGFNHLSYYSKIFFRKYNCTPTIFRNS